MPSFLYIYNLFLWLFSHWNYETEAIDVQVFGILIGLFTIKINK
jgi:hypothetical protein